MKEIRNIAIIAHVDHGKTTLVDALLRQSGVFRENEQVVERVMDSNDLEKERGITILAKNTAIEYGEYKFNIVDTPGHADFGGEVERVLKMVDGVILVVDAFDGPMPQTRVVLSKSLELNLKPIVVVNKIDRPGATPLEAVDKVLELFIDLNANDDQLEFPVIYASGKQGVATYDLNEVGTDMKPLFDTIIKYVPKPACTVEGSLQVLVSSIDYDDYVGRIGVGRIERGSIKQGQTVCVCKDENVKQNLRIGKVYTYKGLEKVETDEAFAGDICAFTGIPDINIGETVCDNDVPEAIHFIDIDEPTVSCIFSVNNGPFAGKEGKFITSRHLRERLMKELESNVSLRVEETESSDAFKVSGRGELHLSILIENMRREGYELLVSRPTVIYKEIDGVKCEPIEKLVIDVPEEFVGAVIEKIGIRKGEMTNMTPGKQGYTRLEFDIPARGLIGYRSDFMTDTKGNGVMNHMFKGFEPFKGEISTRSKGTLIAFENGVTNAYGLFNAQERGELFVGAGVKVYEGMIVGENPRTEDIAINVCKEKHLTNMRASGSDEALRLTPPREFSLEQAIEYINDDELVEVTPISIRLRKKILDSKMRERAARK